MAKKPHGGNFGAEIQTIDLERLDNYLGQRTVNLVSLHDPSEYHWTESDDNTYIPPIYDQYTTNKNYGRVWNSRFRNTFYNFGNDNRYPHFLLALKGKASLLDSCQEATIESALGKGRTVTGATPELHQRFESWLRDKGCNYEFDMTMFQNAVIHEGGYVEMKYTARPNGSGGSNGVLSQVKAVGFTKYRVGVEDEQGQTQHYYYHPQYQSKRLDTRRMKAIAAFKNPQDASNRWSEDTVLNYNATNPYYQQDKNKPFNKGLFVNYWYKPNALSDKYPIPNYAKEAVINACIMDSYLPKFDVAAMENGLSVGYILTVPLKQPKRGDRKGKDEYEKKKEKIREDVRNSLQGVENADNLLVLYVDPRSENEPIHIAQVPNNNNHETLIDKDERHERIILNSFRVVHPSLVGVQPRSGRGLNHQANLLNEAEENWYSNFVYGYVKLVCNFYQDLVAVFEYENGLSGTGLYVVFPRDIRFKRKMSDELMLKTLTTERIYEEFGLSIDITPEYLTDLHRDLMLRMKPELLSLSTLTPQDSNDSPDTSRDLSEGDNDLNGSEGDSFLANEQELLLLFPELLDSHADFDYSNPRLEDSRYKRANYRYVKNLKESFPKIWRAGGNEFGNTAFERWTAYRAGDRSPKVLDWVKRRERFMNRHFNNTGKAFGGSDWKSKVNLSSIGGIVAAYKWGGILAIGSSRMRAVIEEMKRKLKE